MIGRISVIQERLSCRWTRPDGIHIPYDPVNYQTDALTGDRRRHCQGSRHKGVYAPCVPSPPAGVWKKRKGTSASVCGQQDPGIIQGLRPNESVDEPNTDVDVADEEQDVSLDDPDSTLVPNEEDPSEEDSNDEDSDDEDSGDEDTCTNDDDPYEDDSDYGDSNDGRSTEPIFLPSRDNQQSNTSDPNGASDAKHVMYSRLLNYKPWPLLHHIEVMYKSACSGGPQRRRFPQGDLGRWFRSTDVDSAFQAV
ncbi:hypothetical protein QBC45DRAFT_437223 [Copromyces sp. CBS 386.78]|nr:hypothetical protein QBC45DRAFT_437223 [Copromyces sp. CBS 386.78]